MNEKHREEVALFRFGVICDLVCTRLDSGEMTGLINRKSRQRWQIPCSGRSALSSFAKSEQIPKFFRTIFKDAYLPYRDPEALNLFLKKINGFSYGNNENLGNAFEYLLSILGSQRAIG